MSTRVAATVFATAFTLTATPAFACAWFEGGWSLQAWEATTAPADGPIVFMLIAEPGTSNEAPEISAENFAVTMMNGEAEVPGGMRVEDTVAGGIKRLVFAPEAPLETGIEYALQVVYNGSPRELVVTVDEPDAMPAITQFDVAEIERPTDQVCCDLPAETCAEWKNCGGGPVRCETCWHAAWEYPVTSSFTWEIPQPELYDFEVYRVDGDTEELVSTVVLNYQLAAWVEWPEDWAGERCVRVDARRFDTDEVLVGEVTCADSFPTVERSADPPAVPENAAECASDPVDEEGNAVDNPKKVRGSSCSTVNGGGVPAALLFFVATLLGRPRRRLTA